MSCPDKSWFLAEMNKAKTLPKIFNCNFLFLFCLIMRFILSEIIWTTFLCHKSQKSFYLLARPLESSYSYLQDTEKLMSSCFPSLFTCKFNLNFLLRKNKKCELHLSTQTVYCFRHFILKWWSMIFFTMSYNSSSKG